MVALAILALIGIAYLKPIQQNERMRAEIFRLDTELKKQEELSRQLKAEIDSLRNNPQTVSRLAREKLGYAKPDETVVHFDPVAGNSPAK